MPINTRGAQLTSVWRATLPQRNTRALGGKYTARISKAGIIVIIRVEDRSFWSWRVQEADDVHPRIDGPVVNKQLPIRAEVDNA